MAPSVYASHPDPARDYAEAVERAAALEKRDGPEVNPAARTCLLAHGKRTGRAFVLLHGYTNSPQGFHALGMMFYELGHNVLIPRELHHGLSDRMNAEQSRVTAAGLVRFADEAVDIARGLGERVTVTGLSMGGVLTAWAAQNRLDIDLAAPISPAFGFQALPRRLAAPAARLALLLPNRFVWWDPKTRAAPVPPLHAYPRFATRALAQIIRLGETVRVAARRSPPKARKVIVIINPSDPSVDNRITEQLVSNWKAAGADQVKSYSFDARLRLIHDLIDPEQTEQQVNVVYPILLDLLA